MEILQSRFIKEQEEFHAKWFGSRVTPVWFPRGTLANYRGYQRAIAAFRKDQKRRKVVLDRILKRQKREIRLGIIPANRPKRIRIRPLPGSSFRF